ncbi:MAG TPA: HAMP domain-containing sensor histidine kinase [Chryseolinea sp.]
MKLLTRTVRNYVLFSALLLLISTPLFYFSIRWLFVSEIDRELRSHKNEFHELLPLLKTQNELKFFSLMNDEFLLKESSYLMKNDSFFVEDIFNSREKEIHPYRILRTGVMIQGKPYQLQIQESMVDTGELIGAIVAIQAAVIAMLLLGFGLINRKLSTTIWQPFYVILDRLKKYQIDRDKSILLPHSSTAEFRDLSMAISQLVNRNVEVFQSQKEFTENAAHELQTPLAICRTKLELLAQTKDLTQEQADLVGSLLDATDRITRLNKDLLLLSKIENRQFLNTEEIDLNTVITKCLEVYRHKIQEKKLNVKVSLDETSLITANTVLVEVLINNVISNAIRHTNDGGSVTIQSTKSSLTFSNSGDPLGHPEKIFDRFHRESRTTLGTGLGLSIAKKICEVAGYQIAYDYSFSAHHFKIIFPAPAF